jgi:pimeloyl-ACP methyl ester carboxylesterase
MRKQFLYQHKKISYQVIGKGKPVLLIHGFGELASVWRNQVDPLSNTYQLIIPDIPGSAESEIIDDMTMEGLAEVMHAIIHEEQIDSCPVIGHSMGGYIVLAFVEKYWNHVSGFGLFHATAYADTEEKKAARQKGIEFINKNGSFEFLKTTTPNLFSTESKQDKPQLIEEQLAGMDNFSAPALVSYYKSMMQRPDHTEQLRNSRVPVLFIMGETDPAAPLKDCLEQCHLPENSYIHVLRHSGHMGMLEQPVESNIALEKFLQEI